MLIFGGTFGVRLPFGVNVTGKKIIFGKGKGVIIPAGCSQGGRTPPKGGSLNGTARFATSLGAGVG